MTGSIMLSIRPLYCKLIASEKKKVELRKNEPKSRHRLSVISTAPKVAVMQKERATFLLR